MGQPRVGRANWRTLVFLVALGLALAGGALREYLPDLGAVPAVAQPATVAEAPEVRVLFSRRDDPRGAIKQALAGAQESVLVAMYTFTDRDLAGALAAAQQRGCEVRVYLDRSQAEQTYSQARALAAAGVPVRISSNPRIMHNKFAVIDSATVITGSYNWTIAASKDNDENLLIIPSPELAQQYATRFDELWEEWDPALTAGLR